jgi:hypothetical protein
MKVINVAFYPKNVNIHRQVLPSRWMMKTMGVAEIKKGIKQKREREREGGKTRKKMSLASRPPDTWIHKMKPRGDRLRERQREFDRCAKTAQLRKVSAPAPAPRPLVSFRARANKEHKPICALVAGYA